MFCWGCRISSQLLKSSAEILTWNKKSIGIYSRISQVAQNLYFYSVHLSYIQILSRVNLTFTHNMLESLLKMQFWQSFQADSTFTFTSHNLDVYYLLPSNFHLHSSVALAFYQLKCVITFCSSHLQNLGLPLKKEIIQTSLLGLPEKIKRTNGTFPFKVSLL